MRKLLLALLFACAGALCAVPAHAQIIIIASPNMNVDSITKDELHDKAMTTLAGDGAVEFWIVDPRSASVTVYSRTAGVQLYSTPATVPVPFMEGSIPLDRLFAAL